MPDRKYRLKYWNSIAFTLSTGISTPDKSEIKRKTYMIFYLASYSNLYIVIL